MAALNCFAAGSQYFPQLPIDRGCIVMVPATGARSVVSRAFNTASALAPSICSLKITYKARIITTIPIKRWEYRMLRTCNLHALLHAK